jgi:PHD/YefM family antitoxin component YafN of YafNO toxin-antitoxin module
MPTGHEESRMVTIHPNILERDGKKAFVVLPYEEFVVMEEELQEFEDLKELRAAKHEEGHKPTVPLAEIKKELGL